MRLQYLLSPHSNPASGIRNPSKPSRPPNSPSDKSVNALYKYEDMCKRKRLQERLTIDFDLEPWEGVLFPQAEHVSLLFLVLL